MRVFFLLMLLFSGCAHLVKPGVRPPAPGPASTRVFPVPPFAESAAAMARPAEYEEYYVGMIADYDDPAFAYRPGSLIVQTRSARPGGGAGAPVMVGQGPVTTSGQPNYHPDPTETEISVLVSRSRRAISALTEENERLVAQVQDLQKPAKAAFTSAPVAPPAGGVTAVPDRNDDSARYSLIRPNREYVIELDPNFFLTPSPATNNPFVQLYQPPVSFRDLSLVISAAVPGPTPSAVINDEPYSVGDRLEGMTVYRIEPDTVYLLKDAFLLACPVSERALKLRLP